MGLRWLDRWWPKFGFISDRTGHCFWQRIAWDWTETSKPHLVIMFPWRWRFRLRYMPKAHRMTLRPERQFRFFWEFRRIALDHVDHCMGKTYGAQS